MGAPDPISIVAAAMAALGATMPAHPDVRPARGDGDWYTSVARRPIQGKSTGPTPTAVADQLRIRPEVSWARTRGSGVLFAVHAEMLPRALDSVPAPAFSRASLSRDWPADLWPVAFAHARTRNLARAAADHGVEPVGKVAGDAQAARVLAQPQARDLLAHVVTATARRRTDRVLLRATAAQFQQWFAGTRITPRGSEPVASCHRIRLALNNATGNALAAGLATLGLDPPEHL